MIYKEYVENLLNVLFYESIEKFYETQFYKICEIKLNFYKQKALF